MYNVKILFHIYLWYTYGTGHWGNLWCTYGIRMVLDTYGNLF